MYRYNNFNQGLGSGMNGQLTFLDNVSLMSFFISLMNLNENLTQNDKQDLQKSLENKSKIILDEIQKHLQIQDQKIDLILEKLEELSKNDNR